MSMKHYMEAAQLLRAHPELEPTFRWGAVEPETVIEAERRLGMRLPQAYLAFLREFNAGAFESVEIYGLPKDLDEHTHRNAVWRTEDLRQLGALEPRYLVVHSLGDGSKTVIDTSKSAGPVSSWLGGGVEQIAEDFGEFFLQTVKEAIARIDGETE